MWTSSGPTGAPKAKLGQPSLFLGRFEPSAQRRRPLAPLARSPWRPADWRRDSGTGQIGPIDEIGLPVTPHPASFDGHPLPTERVVMFFRAHRDSVVGSTYERVGTRNPSPGLLHRPPSPQGEGCDLFSGASRCWTGQIRPIDENPSTRNPSPASVVGRPPQ
jgi:hypothetical protein